MDRKAFFPLVASVMLVACGEPQGESSSSGDGGGGSASTGSTTDSNTGSTTDTDPETTTTSPHTGTPTGKTVTITMDSFDIPSGAEVYKCQDFANPFGGDAEVSTFESHMTAGSHHLLLFYKDGAGDSPLEDCSGLEFAATPYSTQLPDDAVGFPEGVAAAIPSTKGLRLQSHYLNTTADTVKAHVEVTFHLADPATVKDHAGVMFIVQTSINVQPFTTKDIAYDCNVPQDMMVMKTASHMHKHGTKFVSTVADKPFYQTETWDEPVPALFEPAMPLKKGDPLHFACTFENNSASTLTFGESADTNEMCILVASFYPVPAGKTTIGCN